MRNRIASAPLLIAWVAIPIFAQDYIITTVAGPGQPYVHTFAGDGGPAASAQLNNPMDVMIDRSGNLIIADTGNGRVRKVVNGTITTIAGGGTAVGDGGQATAARLFYPIGLAMDHAGNLYIAEQNRIRKVSPDGIITTVAGGGRDATSDGVPAIGIAVGATSMAVDKDDNLLYADTSANRIRRISKDGIVRTIAGSLTPGPPFAGDGGPARNARLNQPWGVAVDSAGNIFISDTSNNRIRKIATDGTIVTLTITPASPIRVVADSAGNLFYCVGAQVLGLSANGTASAPISSMNASNVTDDGGLAGLAAISQPHGLALDANGNLYIADSAASAVRLLRPVKPLDLKTGYWDITQHLPMPAQLQEAFAQQLAAAEKLPEAQRAAYIAQIQQSQKQIENGMDIKSNVCVTSEHPVASLLFASGAPGPCIRKTSVTDQQLTMSSTCTAAGTNTSEKLVLDRADSTRLKGTVHFRTADAGGKVTQETDRAFAGTWVRASCTPTAK